MEHGEAIEPGSEAERQSFPGAAYDVVAIIASAGGLATIRRVLSMLPADFPATIVIAQHLSAQYESRLAEILGRRTKLRVKQADAGDRLEPGVAYISPPDRHLLVNPDGTLSLSRSGQVHHLRPSGDLLFESVAASYGRRAIAIVLSGTGADGSEGLLAVKREGGLVMAQDEATAEFAGMPAAAIRTRGVDLVLPLDDIAPALVTLMGKRSSEHFDE